MGVRNETGYILHGYIYKKGDSEAAQDEFMQFLHDINEYVKEKQGYETPVLRADKVVNGEIRVFIGFTGSKVGWGLQEATERAFEKIKTYLQEYEHCALFNWYKIYVGELTEHTPQYDHGEIKSEGNILDSV